VTGIQWTDRVWNPVRGCSRVSEGCRNCYAERIAARFSGPGKPFAGFARREAPHGPVHPHDLALWEPKDRVARWTGKVALVPEKLDEPLHWRKPSRVFVNSMSDLFHEKLSDGEIDQVFAVMAEAQRHTFQILTKRAERMRQYSVGHTLPGCVWKWPLPNVWLGVSVEDQTTADERIPLLLQTPAAVRFVSYEPALGPVDFHVYLSTDATEDCPACGSVMGCDHGALDWLIYGGESGPGARLNDIAWAESARDQCKEAGVAFFCKQLGAYPIIDPRYVRPRATRFLRDPKGGDPEEWPEDLRVREFPQ